MASTIKDVAKKANVSIATVSRVLNDLGGYSEATKEKVLRAVEELGYQPNALARGLINKKTETVGILFPEVSSMFSSKILRGVEEVVHQLGSSVIVCNTASHGERTLKYLRVLAEKRIDGIIFVSELMKEEYYHMLKVPAVLVATESYRFPIPFVKVNDRHAAYSAAEYLIGNGHKKIGMISGDKHDPIAGMPRVEGYKEALLHNDIQVVEERIVYGKGFHYEDGFASLATLLRQAPDITAVFAASDAMAVGALSAAYKMGLQVPADISMIGYDNLPISEMSIPPLTTVDQQLEKMGETAAKMLFTMMETGKKEESRIMPHQIIERESVKKL